MDCIAPLANAMFARPLVCDQVAKLGGVAIVLAATRGEDGDDYLREWALWGVRNLCAGSDVARGEIERMQPQAAADSQQLAAMGLNVEVDPGTGKVRVGSTRRGRVAATAAGPPPARAIHAAPRAPSPVACCWAPRARKPPRVGRRSRRSWRDSTSVARRATAKTTTTRLRRRRTGKWRT